MTENTISFPLEVDRASIIVDASNAFGDAARLGKLGGSGLIEDNGLLIGIEQKMKFLSAAKLLDGIYTKTRALPEHSNRSVGAASASAMLVEEGIVVHSAGDAPLLVLGDNGNVKLLNDFHAISKGSAAELRVKARAQGKKVSDTAYDEALTHCLAAGRGKFEEDFTKIFSWEELENELGTKEMKVLAVSDGVYGKKEHGDVAEYIKDLLDELAIDDAEFSKKVIRRVLQSDVFEGNEDDVVVLSATRPAPQQSILLHALDGISGGGEASARFVDNAVNVAKKVVQEHLRRPEAVIRKPKISGGNREIQLS